MYIKSKPLVVYTAVPYSCAAVGCRSTAADEIFRCYCDEFKMFSCALGSRFIDFRKQSMPKLDLHYVH